MSGIYGVGHSSYVDYGRFASGKQIQTAADNAAGLAIVEKETARINGYEAGKNNMQAAKSALNISDGALSSVKDYLQRMRELALGAANTAIVSDSDRQNIQKEIDQLKQGIADVASQTQYNTQNLLDGSRDKFDIATDADAHAMHISTGNATLEALGIADFDVTGEFDLGVIDVAIAKVNENRSSIGAQSNALDYGKLYNSNATYNLTGTKSKLEDLDFPQAISDMKKKELMNFYSMMMQKRKQEEESNRVKLLMV